MPPAQIATTAGKSIWAALGIVLVGLALIAKAGLLKEADQAGQKQVQAGEGGSAGEGGGSLAGYIICFVSGIFSCGLNFALAFGDDLGLAAKDM